MNGTYFTAVFRDLNHQKMTELVQLPEFIAGSHCDKILECNAAKDRIEWLEMRLASSERIRANQFDEMILMAEKIEENNFDREENK